MKKKKIPTVFRQLKDNLNGSEFNRGRITNQHGITFTTFGSNRDEYSRSESFLATFTIEVDKHVFTNGNLKVYIPIRGNNRYRLLLDDLTPNLLWENRKGSGWATNDGFLFRDKFIINALGVTSIIHDKNLSLAEIVAYTLSDYERDYKKYSLQGYEQLNSLSD